MKKESKILISSLFECENKACFCEKDIENVAPGEPPKATLKVCADESRPLQFSYAPGEGLNLTGPAGGLVESNLLGKLLAIPDDDIDALISYFEKYGFLFPIGSNSYEAANADDIIAVIRRIKSTIRLMNSIGKRNYRNVLVNAAYLLYAPSVEFYFSDYYYSTCKHRYTELIETYNLFPDLDRNQEVFDKGTYSVYDSFLKKENPVNIDFYNAVRSGSDTSTPGSTLPHFKNLMAVYTGCTNEDADTRFLIDFFYDFQTQFSIFKEVKYQKIVPCSAIDESQFTNEIKDALIKIARIVVASEINHNIKNIYPRYDGGELSASWQVDTLIDALYFSLFYMKAGVEIYKECENPNCKRDKYFLVEATRTNKKYCCRQCANAAAAQRHRNRNLNK